MRVKMLVFFCASFLAFPLANAEARTNPRPCPKPHYDVTKRHPCPKPHHHVTKPPKHNPPARAPTPAPTPQPPRPPANLVSYTYKLNAQQVNCGQGTISGYLTPSDDNALRSLPASIPAPQYSVRVS